MTVNELAARTGAEPVVLADGGRPHATVNGVGRIGGLQKSEAKCEDGMH